MDRIYTKKLMSDRILDRLSISTSSGLFLPEIDGIRALAVSIVFFFHAWVTSGSPILPNYLTGLQKILANGGYGVDIFFVLSGFLLILPWIKESISDKKSITVRNYLWKRVKRIVPAYYVNLFFMFFIMAPLILGKDFMFSFNGIVQLLSHMTFTHYLHPMTSSSLGLNGSLWTLSLEAQFYVLLPLLSYFFIKNRYKLALPLFIIISIAWKYYSLNSMNYIVSLLMQTVSQWNVDENTIRFFLSNQFPGQLGHFALGMTLGNLYINFKFNGNKNQEFKRWLTIFSLIGFISTLYMFKIANLSVAPWWYLWRTYIGFGAACLIFLSVIQGPLLFRSIFRNSWVRIIGIISYSIFLWHVPIMFILHQWIIPHDVSSLHKFILTSLLGAIITLVISYLSFCWIEKPFMGSGKIRFNNMFKYFMIQDYVK